MSGRVNRLCVLLVLLLPASGCIVLTDVEPPETPQGASSPAVWQGPDVATEFHVLGRLELLGRTDPEVVPFPYDDDEALKAEVRATCAESRLAGAPAGRRLRLVARLTTHAERGDQIARLFPQMLTFGLWPSWVDFDLRVWGGLVDGAGRVVAKTEAASSITQWSSTALLFTPWLWGLVDGGGVGNAVCLEHYRALTRRVLADLLPRELELRRQDSQADARAQDMAEARRSREAAFERAQRAVADRTITIGETDAEGLVAAVGEGERRPQGDGTEWLEVFSGDGTGALRFVLGVNGRLVRVVERARDGVETDWTPRLQPVTAPTVAAPTVTVPTRAGRTFVLVVGVDDYEDERIPDLRFAQADARAVSTFYASHERSPADRDRVSSLVGRDATRAGVLQAIRTHLVQRATDVADVAVLYFAGHGFADANDTYLACADTTLDALPETSISVAGLQTAWDRIQAGTKVLITDACHAGALANLRGVGGVRTVLPARAAGGRVGTISIVASGENQLSIENAALGRGVFTTALVNALSGDADRDEDRVVTLGELTDYLRAQVPRLARAVGGNQEPVIRFAQGAEALPLTR
jgi:hypothetical protein